MTELLEKIDGKTMDRNIRRLKETFELIENNRNKIKS